MTWTQLAKGSRVVRRAMVLGLVLMCGVQSACHAQAPWPLWDAYTQKFMDKQGRIIDHNGGDRTTSEGQAYGMFFALVAGDRPKFDKLVEWTEVNLAQGDLTARLPAWLWGKAPDGSWRVLDSNPASDADLWMAYALCEAGRLWKAPRYEKMGTLLAARVAKQEVALVPGLGTTMIPGLEGFHPDAKTWILNPSYLPSPLLVYFARRTPGSKWNDVLQTLPAMVHTDGGFAMDWMSVGPGGVKGSVNPAKLAAGPSMETPVGSYDAIRVYLWAGISDPRTDGLRDAMAEMRGMATYLKTHPLPPLEVDPAGKVLATDAPVGFSAAVIPYLHSLGMKAEERSQADRVAALRDGKTGLYGRSPTYYDQNLAMFSLGWTEQRFRFGSDGRLTLKWK